MKKILFCSLSILSIISCSRKENCPPCTNCNTTITYQVDKTGSDTLIVGYNKFLSGYYEGCALTEFSVDTTILVIAPATYTWKVNSIIGGFASIHGTSREKGWVLKILSPSGNVVATTEHKSYYERVNSYWGLVYENGLAIKYQ